jgi:hypothetical protein
MGLLFGKSSARQRPVSNNQWVFPLGSVLNTRCHWKIHLIIQPELQKGEIGRSRHALVKQWLKTEIKWKMNVKWSTLRSYHSCICGVSMGNGLESRCWIPGRGEIFRFSTASRPVLGPTHTPIQWVPGALSRGLKTFANYDYLYILP